MRGTQQGAGCGEGCQRIIPAHAGNSSSFHRFSSWIADHPRACGELSCHRFVFVLAFGSSPRMRGTPAHRGDQDGQKRIIPAHAGNSRSSVTPPSTDTDHPRACGELSTVIGWTGPLVGSSPRMRGTLHPPELDELIVRIIPAHAGNSSSRPMASRRPTDHPRACGELIPRRRLSSVSSGSSPRMRGTHSQPLPRVQRGRIIPAHAGNSRPPALRSIFPTDHPRACGEL